MPTVELVPGDYWLDAQEWQFVQCMKTGQCYAVWDGVPDQSHAYAGLSQLLCERHPRESKSSGRQRTPYAKGKIRFLGVELTIWEKHGGCLFLWRIMCETDTNEEEEAAAGFGNDAFTLPHTIPRLTPAQLAIAGPQPAIYSSNRVFPYANAWSKRGRIWSKGAPEEPSPLPTSTTRTRATKRASADSAAPKRRRRGHSPPPPAEEEDKDGVLFDAPFTCARLLLVSHPSAMASSRHQRGLEGAVDALFDTEVARMEEERGRPIHCIRMLQRWLRALSDGGDRAIARLRAQEDGLLPRPSSSSSSFHHSRRGPPRGGGRPRAQPDSDEEEEEEEEEEEAEAPLSGKRLAFSPSL